MDEFKKKAMKYNPEKHHRRSIRLKGYDYASAGLYFITICTQNYAHLFGEIKNGAMIQNRLAAIITESWDAIPHHFPNTKNHEFIMMPNHIHGIIEILDTNENTTEEIGQFKSPSKTIGSIIRGFKIGTKKGFRAFFISTGEKSFALKEAAYKKGKKSFTLKENERSENEYKKGERFFAPTTTTTAEMNILKKIDFDKSIWQRNYYEHIIRDDNAYQNISNYIINNPKKWAEDKFFKEKEP
ncbi:MAG: hypothetical protein COB98_05855 [Flavobacteriaceae bacterium]|nr:MAG: hypothetical protein COB98_05855 [Flavobacteriaceae bacterium]